MEYIQVESTEREEMIDITQKVEAVLAQQAWQNGALLLFCQHTTCALTINEGADPALRMDLLRYFAKLAPNVNNWTHYEGNTDAHIKCSLFGVSLLIPVQKAHLELGSWQSIYLYEGDGPRLRSILCQFLQE